MFKDSHTTTTDGSKKSECYRRSNSTDMNFSFKELCMCFKIISIICELKSINFTGTLSKTTPDMRGALEIGEVAEQYLAEGNYSLALDKFQSCLKVLVPMLGKEPPGRRRDLLGKQVYCLLTFAMGQWIMFSDNNFPTGAYLDERGGEHQKPSYD